MACCEDAAKIEEAKTQIMEIVSQSGGCCVVCVTDGCCCKESSDESKKKDSVLSCPCC